LVAGGAGLQRLTILAADPDATTVVVQADYFTPRDASPSELPRLEHSSRQPAPTARSPLSSYLNPLQLYARTQRGLDDERRTALLDVHA
jgi:hypothetical protein